MPGTEERDAGALSMERQQAINEVVEIAMKQVTDKLHTEFEVKANAPAAMPVTMAGKTASKSNRPLQ